MGKNKTILNPFKILFGLCRLAFKYPLLLLVILSATLGVYGYEVKVARPPLLYQGEPEPINAKNVDTWFRILRNHGFILGYSDLRGNPLWVEYALTPVDEKQPSLKRLDRFEVDWRSFNRVSQDSYRRSGYDRGHLAPNYAISRIYGREGQADSFLMTNITPQRPELNRQVWQRLEEMEIKHFARTFGKVWVIAGPVFDGTRERLPSDWRVEIPDAFFKIYIAESEPGKAPSSLAFLVPQTVKGNEPLTQFMTNIDSIEAQTGIDFFGALDDRVETQLESVVDHSFWIPQALGKQQARH